MLRRDFLRLCTATATVPGILQAAGDASGRGESDAPVIRTVRGDISASELGRTLPHEHVLVDFIGADAISPARYDPDAVFGSVLPHLQQARRLGFRSLLECTPAYIGRDPALLARLSAATGLNIITNTGLYGARQNRFIPAAAHSTPAAELARNWMDEARHGIDGTGIRPGFIKSGVDSEPELSPLHRRLVVAAALTHAETGLTIAIHTGRGPGLEELEILHEHGVGASAFVWVHAQGARDDELFAAADKGAWISLDGINRPTLQRHLHLCTELKRRGHLGRTLLSHDAGWFDPGKPEGGTFRPFELLSTAFVPLLRENGFSQAEIDRMTIANPAEAFALRKRPAI